MNYLAHLVLAGGSDDELVGNLLGDFVKGNPAGRFNADICRGIGLHRKVDRFADSHPVTRQSRARFSDRRRRFAGIIVDVSFDHYLSRHWSRFSRRDRSDFIGHVYRVLLRHRPLLPGRLRRLLPRIIDEDWLGSYRDLDRVGTALDRIAGRLSTGERFRGAISEVRRHYSDLEDDFLRFFPELIDYAGELRKR